MTMRNEIANEIKELLEKMFPTPEQRVGGPDSTFMRVNRLMLLSGKLALIIVGEFTDEEIGHVEKAIERNNRSTP